MQIRQQARIVTPGLRLVLTVFAQIVGLTLCQAQSSNVIGTWSVEVTFKNGESRSLRFDARAAGKASLLTVVPNQIGPSELSAAKWTQNDKQSLAFSGPVQFPLGNVGLQRGTLVFKGKFGADGSITGEADFFAADQDQTGPKSKAVKSGSFKAVRVTTD